MLLYLTTNDASLVFDLSTPGCTDPMRFSLTLNEVERHLEAARVAVAVVEHERAEAYPGRRKFVTLRRVQREQHGLQRLHAALRHERPAARRARAAVAARPAVHLRVLCSFIAVLGRIRVFDECKLYVTRHLNREKAVLSNLKRGGSQYIFRQYIFYLCQLPNFLLGVQLLLYYFTR